VRGTSSSVPEARPVEEEDGISRHVSSCTRHKITGLATSFFSMISSCQLFAGLADDRLSVTPVGKADVPQAARRLDEEHEGSETFSGEAGELGMSRVSSFHCSDYD
jgi:hypothetical protein